MVDEEEFIRNHECERRFRALLRRVQEEAGATDTRPIFLICSFTLGSWL